MQSAFVTAAELVLDCTVDGLGFDGTALQLTALETVATTATTTHVRILIGTISCCLHSLGRTEAVDRC